MDLSKLTPNLLRELLKLSETKAALQQQVAAIDAQISALGSGQAPLSGKNPAASKAVAPGKRLGRPPVATAAPKTPKPAKASNAANGTGKRGAMKGEILRLLSAAGPEGASVKDLSATLGVKSQNVHVWFSTTGKKLPEISKVGAGRYAFTPAAETAAAA